MTIREAVEILDDILGNRTKGYWAGKWYISEERIEAITFAKNKLLMIQSDSMAKVNTDGGGK
jgi:hypothetical protein